MDAHDHGPELGASLQRALQICEEIAGLASELRKLVSHRPAPPIKVHDGSVVGVIRPHCTGTDDPPSRPA